MNKINLFLILTVVAGCFGGRTKMITGLEGRPLPNFNMLLTDSVTTVNTEKLQIGKAIVLFYFRPNCPYCRAQTEELKSHLSSMDKVKVYMISNFSITSLKKFDKDFELSKYPNLQIARVTDSTFDKFYNIPGVPYIAVYNKNKILNEVFLGKVDSKDVKEVALN